MRARSDAGAAAIEYALLAALVALVIIGAVALFGDQLADLYTWIVDSLPFGG